MVAPSVHEQGKVKYSRKKREKGERYPRGTDMLESYFLGTRVSRSYCSRITVAWHCSRKGIFGRKGFILVRVLIRFWFKYSF